MMQRVGCGGCQHAGPLFPSPLGADLRLGTHHDPPVKLSDKRDLLGIRLLGRPRVVPFLIGDCLLLIGLLEHAVHVVDLLLAGDALLGGGRHGLSLSCRLGIDVVDVRHTPLEE